MESGYWSEFKRMFNKQIITIKTLCKITMITLVSILLLQTVFYDLLPLTSAIEASLFPTLSSIHFCIFFLDDSYIAIIRNILSLNIWKSMRNVVRISSVFHALVFTSISMLLPLTNKNFFSIIIHMSFTITINYVICSIIEFKLEKPIINYIMMKVQ